VFRVGPHTKAKRRAQPQSTVIMAGVGSYESVERVAWHEAGHAVANHRLGHGVIEVRLHDTGVNCQADRWDYRSALPTRPDGLYSGTELVNAARPYAVAILAGNAAEARHVELETLRDCWSSKDLAQVETWLQQVVHPDEV
jgi:hypothetical protein